MNSQSVIAAAILGRTNKASIVNVAEPAVPAVPQLSPLAKFQDLPPVEEVVHPGAKNLVVREPVRSTLLDKPRGENVRIFMGPPESKIWFSAGPTNKRFDVMGLYETSDPLEIAQLQDLWGVREVTV